MRRRRQRFRRVQPVNPILILLVLLLAAWALIMLAGPAYRPIFFDAETQYSQLPTTNGPFVLLHGE